MVPAPTTFAVYGRALGLSDDVIIDASCDALVAAGPGVGGRFVSPNHCIEDDSTSLVALDSLLRRSRAREAAQNTSSS